MTAPSLLEAANREQVSGGDDEAMVEDTFGFGLWLRITNIVAAIEGAYH